MSQPDGDGFWEVTIDAEYYPEAFGFLNERGNYYEFDPIGIFRIFDSSSAVMVKVKFS